MIKETNFEALYKLAKQKLVKKVYTPNLYTGQVACALVTKDNNIYTGVSIEMHCGLGLCAERSAFVNMLQNGESIVKKLVCVVLNNKINQVELINPCGVCREFALQMSKENEVMQVLTNLETEEYITLENLFSNWWAKNLK